MIPQLYFPTYASPTYSTGTLVDSYQSTLRAGSRVENQMSRAESAAEDTRRLESQVETPPSRIGELMSNIIF